MKEEREQLLQQKQKTQRAWGPRTLTFLIAEIADLF
jgi:hypothetical protein